MLSKQQTAGSKCIKKTSRDPPKDITQWGKNTTCSSAELWLWGSAAGGACRDCVVWSGCSTTDLWPRHIWIYPPDCPLPTGSPLLCQKQRYKCGQGLERLNSINDSADISSSFLSSGWSSFYPSLTVVHYGIPCYEMEVGDVCLPPGHRDAKHTEDSPVFDTFKR